ncbi:RNA-binding S4 domain-containing protein [Novosphingobium sp.]|uniref:RNA-binding S4 domain-containing protein n=1 Tax=Novosphingobium sp. TaxID=1874826 RepID=UPI0025DFEECA|nr:RNA-binding S4 domain-containing protein [Novosphingobium sp.]MCC6927137.1 RNA-binding S4 domain-containing protein [Novosphingobium sp.]
MRIDKLLWFLRLAASRSFAQQWVQAGHIRLNGRRVEKPGTAIKPGDVLTLPMRSRVKVIEIGELPGRRGPAGEAQACYRVLDERGANPIAGAVEDHSSGDTLP